MVNISRYCLLIILINVVCSFITDGLRGFGWVSSQCRHLAQEEQSDSLPRSTKDATIAKYKTLLKNSLIASMLISFAKPALAQRGAFEMDTEFYIRNLLGMRQSQSPLFKTLGSFGSPRHLDGKFSAKIIDLIYLEIANISKTPAPTLRSAVQEKVPYFVKYFKTFAPLTDEVLTDQYYFDMMIYLIYLESANYLKTSQERVQLRERIGASILDMLIKQGDIDITTNSSNILNLVNGVQNFLETYKAKGIIGNFSFDPEDLTDEIYVNKSFQDKLPVSFQVTLIKPATILGFLQQAQANSLYHPEIAATVIQAMARRLGFDLKFDDYLMDNYYREENFDVQAQDILLECILYPPSRLN